MPADHTGPLIALARQRRELTRAKAIRAIRELDNAGTPVTFEVVARTAAVSRSWLYAQPDIRDQIERLREATRHTPAPPIPARQRTSDPSLRTRLDTALNRNRELAEENQRLRRQLAQALGERRQAPKPRTATQPRTARTGHGSATIGPCQ
jgi:Family of unknown function (DUF6262)